jgi:hypothetical protein
MRQMLEIEIDKNKIQEINVPVIARFKTDEA